MPQPVKALLGYDIAEDVSVEAYEDWLWNIHYPDLLANPWLDKIVLNDVLRPINTTSDGSKILEGPQMFYRIVELHYKDMSHYERYLEWFRDHPISPDRGPAGWTDFRFYVLCHVSEATRQT